MNGPMFERGTLKYNTAVLLRPVGGVSS